MSNEDRGIEEQDDKVEDQDGDTEEIEEVEGESVLDRRKREYDESQK